MASPLNRAAQAQVAGCFCLDLNRNAGINVAAATGLLIAPRRSLPVMFSDSTALLLNTCCTSILEPAGPVARGQRLILMDALVIMLAIVVPTIIATLAFAWWYRASNGKA